MLAVLALVVAVFGPGVRRGAVWRRRLAAIVDLVEVPLHDIVSLLHRDHRVAAGGIDEAALAGALAVLQGGKRSHRRIDRADQRTVERAAEIGADVAPIGLFPHQPILVLAQHDPATYGLELIAVAGDRSILAEASEAVCLAIDDIGLDLALLVIADAQLVAGVGGEAIDEDVAILEQFEEDFAPAVGAQIELDAALVAVAHEVERTIFRRHKSAEYAQVVALPRPFNLDHVGPEIGHQPAGVVTCRQPRAFKHADSLQQRNHRSSFLIEKLIVRRPNARRGRPALAARDCG